MSENPLIKFFSSDEFKAIMYYKFITKRLNNRERVPNYVFQRYVSLISNSPTDFDEIIKTASEDAIRATLKRFNSDPKFRFSGYKKTRFYYSPDQKGIVHREKYDFESMIRFVFNAITNSIERNWTGHQAVQETYLMINHYLDKYSSSTNKRFLTRYKRGAVATYICIQFGYKFQNIVPNDIEQLSNHELYQSTRYAIDVMLKKLGETEVN